MFRNRRSGPPPFQVMSNSWRSPKAEPAKPTPRAADESRPEPVVREPRQIRLSAEPPPKARPARETEPATPEARKKRDGASKPGPKRSVDWSGIGRRISDAVGWIGGATLEAAGYLRERMRPLIKKAKPWFTRSSSGQLPRPTVIIGFVALAVTIMAIFWMNRDAGVNTPSLHQPSLAVKDSNLDALQPVESIGGGHAAGDPAAGGQPQTRANPVTPADIQPKPKLSRLAVDPREKGKRYFTLATYSVNKEQFVLPLLEYLWSQGVEAAAINGHNSRFFEVVALQGFTREEISAKAHKQYEDALRAIGRKWKSEGGGNDNLQGLYLSEYSGGQAKLSITKAN